MNTFYNNITHFKIFSVTVLSSMKISQEPKYEAFILEVSHIYRQCSYSCLLLHYCFSKQFSRDFFRVCASNGINYRKKYQYRAY